MPLTKKRKCEKDVQKLSKKFQEKGAIYPIDYKTIDNVRVNYNGSIIFKRTDRPFTWEYSFRNLSLGFPNYPISEKLEKRLTEEAIEAVKQKDLVGFSVDDLSEEELQFILSGAMEYAPHYLVSKIFLDGIKRVTREQESIMNLFSVKGRLPVEMTVSKESFLQLRCQNCGAGQFEIGVASLKTPTGTYSLLKCKYCGFEGILQREAKTYKLILPKPSERGKSAKEERKR